MNRLFNSAMAFEGHPKLVRKKKKSAKKKVTNTFKTSRRYKSSIVRTKTKQLGGIRKCDKCQKKFIRASGRRVKTERGKAVLCFQCRGVRMPIANKDTGKCQETKIGSEKCLNGETYRWNAINWSERARAQFATEIRNGGSVWAVSGGIPGLGKKH